MPERLKGVDCKFIDICLRWFKSILAQNKLAKLKKMKKYLADTYKFQFSRRNRIQFRRDQKKVWFNRLNQYQLSSTHISKKVLSQLSIFDQKAIIASEIVHLM